jgi:hypothetical protein
VLVRFQVYIYFHYSLGKPLFSHILALYYTVGDTYFSSFSCLHKGQLDRLCNILPLPLPRSPTRGKPLIIARPLILKEILGELLKGISRALPAKPTRPVISPATGRARRKSCVLVVFASFGFVGEDLEGAE